jgi:hypothetical protein
MQGYLYYRPISLSSFINVLQTQNQIEGAAEVPGARVVAIQA